MVSVCSASGDGLHTNNPFTPALLAFPIVVIVSWLSAVVVEGLANRFSLPSIAVYFYFSAFV